MSISVPLGLRNGLESGNCVLFLGAGVGHNQFDRLGNPAPDGTQLARELIEHFKIDGASDPPELPKIAQVVEYRFGRAELDTFVKKRLSDLTPDEHVQWLTTIRWRAIFTTNYDLGILRAYELNANPPQQPVAMASTSELLRCDPRVQVPVYYLHGSLLGHEPALIITEDDYARFRNRRHQLFEILKQEFAESTILYIGYSNRDPNWRIVLEELRAEFAPKTPPQAYRVVASSDNLDIEILQRKSIETLVSTLEEFHGAAAVALSTGPVSYDILEGFKSTLPAQFSSAFDKNPAAVVRLLGAWEYCNSARFDEAPNTPAFYRGDKANWGVISRGLAFERDITPRVYDSILDYITSTSNRPTSVAVLGSAGYGTSTLLMTLIADAIEDRAGNIFLLRDGQVPSEGDVEFAATFDRSTPTIFVVDSAAKHSSALRSCIQRLRDLRLPALFILGSRLNEWHEAVGRPAAREYVIDSLSDDEINRLLDCLSKVDELGVLTQLPREFQFNAVKQKYLNQLLVALREATEGRQFDAIIEDEYRALSEDARAAYLIVSCFFQSGVYVRDTLLADLLGVPLSEMYRLIGGPTEGVIFFDDINVATGSYGARTRHRTIARIIWERCGTAGERERLVSEALTRLNLNYQVDVEAFWEFVQSVDLVDGLRTLDDKIRFFETACQKDPRSPYVRQHYARMFKRGGHLPLALKEIDAAIELGPGVKVLYHTRGLILADLAMQAPSDELARRRLVQSEDAFNKCIVMDRRDDYGYTGLAEIYLKWARRIKDEDESNEYVSKAESVISEGLRFARSHEQLWIVSSEIERFLGFEPKRVAALERALGSVAASRTARYLLGRYYRSKARPADALKILKPALDNFPEDYRLFIEYANAMLEDGEPYKKAAAVLQLSNITGMRDARYIANLGGMLFMSGDYTESERIFSTTADRHFSFSEATRPHYVPRDPDSLRRPLRLQGKVAAVKPGYTFIDSGDMPSFFYYGTKAGGVVLRDGLDVTFEPGFSARGRIAQSVTVVSPVPDQKALFS